MGFAKTILRGLGKARTLASAAAPGCPALTAIAPKAMSCHGCRSRPTTRAIATDITTSMKFVDSRPYADPEAAARKLIELANAVEPVQDGRIFIELVNGPFLFDLRGTPAEYRAGLNLAIELGWLWMHESGTYVKFTQSGADLFA
jgi:hypothetical protein